MIDNENQLEIKEEKLWDTLVESIVRPPRQQYCESMLGDTMYNYRKKFYMRTDYTVPCSKDKNKSILLSLYATGEYSSHVIIYLHGNASSRLEALSLMKYMPKELSLACFDFMGCGKNKHQKTISLGCREAEQVDLVVKYLRGLGYRSILWGRSMGAMTALLHGKADIIVADSAFTSFKGLCQEIVSKNKPKIVPGCIVNCIFPCLYERLRKDVNKRAAYDIESLNIGQAVKKLHPSTMTIFMTGDCDELIDGQNSKTLYEMCSSVEKHYFEFEGSHNSDRPEEVMSEIMELIVKKVT